MVYFRNIEQNNPENSVLNNIVDKDVQAMLLPLNLMQFISFTPKYRIQNNRIGPKGFNLKSYSMIGASIFISSYVLRTILLYCCKNQFKLTKFLEDVALIDCFFYSIGFAMNFVIGIIQTKNNIKFVLLFQRVHRLLNNKSSFSHFIIRNWITVILAFSCNFIIFTYFYIQLPLPWFYLLVGYLFVIFDFGVVYPTRAIKLLEDKLKLWSLKVLNSIEAEYRRGDDFSKLMFQAYADILECYDLLKVCFQPYILYYTIEVFLHSIMYIEEAIEIFKAGITLNETHDATLGMLGILCWLVKVLTWQTMFMQQCDAFYLAVHSVQDSCALKLKSNCSDEEKKLYKNVLRVHRASFSKMRVCGLFYADAALHLSLMSLLANYTIVLLQFAFL